MSRLNKNQKPERRIPEKSNIKRKILGIGFITICILLIFLAINLDASEWCLYNLIYRPWYFIFSDLLYSAYFIKVVGKIIIILILATVIWAYIPNLISKDKSILKKLGALIIIGIMIFVVSVFSKPLISDAQFVPNDKYLTEESNLSRYRRVIESGSRGGRSHAYRLYTNELKGVYSKRELKRAEKSLHTYKYLKLNVFQYKDLERLHSEYSAKNDSVDIKLKVYYLPNTKQVLRYELLE